MLRLLQNIPLIYYVIGAFFNFVTAIVISLIVFLSRKKSKANKIFAIFSFSVAYWSLLYFIWLTTTNKEWAEFYLRSCMIGVLFMPSLFVHFVVSFLNLKINKKFILGNYVLSFLFTLTVYTSLYAKDIGRYLVFRYWLHTGPIFHLALIHFGTVVLYSFYLMLRSIKKEKGIFRNQILYIFIGTAIGYISGVTNFFCWYRINIPPFLNSFVSVYVIMVAVAVLKYRLMDIGLAGRYAILYFLYGIISLAFFIPLLLIFRFSILGLLIIGLIMIFSVPYLHQKMTKFLEPAFLGETFRIWDRLRYFWGKP
ncbi:MAG: hypothetical protein NC822_07440, partial [Candidatus Omnitrophica bacterium]|nr:hypothetical protein [Candidatus Omnitrophota bacterium]